jgi:hypothetical protein
MPKDEEQSPASAEPPTRKDDRPWFRPNHNGPGWHPSSWQGWLILGVVVAAIVVVVVLLKTRIL